LSAKAAFQWLAPIDGWCSEGFNITDRQQAKALLETLA